MPWYFGGNKTSPTFGRAEKTFDSSGLEFSPKKSDSNKHVKKKRPKKGHVLCSQFSGLLVENPLPSLKLTACPLNMDGWNTI